ncbi:NUDIX domain-containing protein [Roseovarius sp.]|uniref:NUDIX domain-containing protein n=1 Tax=Roseovarius sp. TaxID=1486281 RepID=UPI003A97346C
MPPPRLAARAVIVVQDRLLLVNAYADAASTLWCAPGGGVETGSSLPDNLIREVHEETGLTIRVGPPCLINEFHAPGTGFHQVEVFFRCTLITGTLSDDWQDPERIVTRRQWVTQAEMESLRFKPDSLVHVAFRRGMGYDPLEEIVGP